jgi:hypothetical protein
MTPFDKAPSPPTGGSGRDYYAQSGSTSGVTRFCVARHGNVPAKVTPWQAGTRPPGAINLSFFDTHVEVVPIANLWSLPWSRDWVPPANPALLVW